MGELNFETSVLDTLSAITARLDIATGMRNLTTINKTLLKDYITDIYAPYYIAKTKKLSSIKSDLSRLSIIENHELSKKNLEDLKTHDIELFLIELVQKNRKKATINRYRSRLLAIFNHAIRNKVLDNNVVEAIKCYKEHSRDIVLTEEEISRLLRESQKSRNIELYLILTIALNTGMRQGEILNLQRDNIVSSNIVLFENETKSGYKRVIPMNDTLKELIETHQETFPTGRDNLFVSKCIRGAFKGARERAGLRYFRFHDLRRTFATHLKDRDVNIYDLKELLGHCSITMTEKYLTTNIEKLTKAVNKIAYC